MFLNTPGMACQRPTEGLGFSAGTDICFGMGFVIDDSIDNLLSNFHAPQRTRLEKYSLEENSLADVTRKDSTLTENIIF